MNPGRSHPYLVPAALALAWQWDHGLPSLELLRNGRLHKNAAIGPGALLGGLLLEQGPLGLAPAAVPFQASRRYL